MPYYLVSSTKEAHVFAKDENEAKVNFCWEIDQDHSDAEVTELDPNDKEDAKFIKMIKERESQEGKNSEEGDEE